MVENCSILDILYPKTKKRLFDDMVCYMPDYHHTKKEENRERHQDYKFISELLVVGHH